MEAPPAWTSQILTVAVLMIVLDVGWLTARTATNGSMFAALQGSPLSIRWPAAILCYIVMIVGLWWFAVRGTASWQAAAANGAGLGALVYGVYDLTNHATLQRFPFSYAVVDWIWGTALFAVVAAVARSAAG